MPIHFGLFALNLETEELGKSRSSDSVVKLETLLASNRPVNSAAPLPDPSSLPVTIH